MLGIVESGKISPNERDPGSTLSFGVILQFTPMTCAKRFEVELLLSPRPPQYKSVLLVTLGYGEFSLVLER